MVTQERLNELFSYDENTGNLIRKIARQRVKPGEIAGSQTAKGYLRTSVDGRLYMNHVLVWILNYGSPPRQQLDHINRNKKDNRLTNLREVDTRENCCNRSNHNSGFPGVDFHRKSNLWRSRIRVGKSRYSLGYFKDPELAGIAHSRAARYVKNLISMLKWAEYGVDKWRR